MKTTREDEHDWNRGNNRVKALAPNFVGADGGQRFDVALHLATKDLVRLRLKEAEQNLKAFAERYGTSFEQFQRAWEEGRIADKHSYEVEKDFWEWEPAHTDSLKLNDMLDKLP